MDGENQLFSEIPLDTARIRSILNSAEGKALIRALQKDGGTALRSAAESLRSGDSNAARALLEPLLRDRETAELAERLGGRL